MMGGPQGFALRTYPLESLLHDSPLSRCIAIMFRLPLPRSNRVLFCVCFLATYSQHSRSPDARVKVSIASDVNPGPRITRQRRQAISEPDAT